MIKNCTQLLLRTLSRPETLQYFMSTIPPQEMNILSLEQFIERRKSDDPREKFETGSSDVLKYGSDPLRFRHEAMVYFKYAYYSSNFYGEQTLLDFIYQLQLKEAQTRQFLNIDPQDQSALSQLQLIRAYQHELSKTLFPVTIYRMQLCTKYLEQLTNYLNSVSQLDAVTTKIVLENILRITFPQQEDWQSVSQRSYGMILYQAFMIYLDKLEKQLPKLDGDDKESIISIGKSLKCDHSGFLEFVKKQLQKEKKQISLSSILLGFNLLAINKTFPYEFFYSNKSNILSSIQLAYTLSDKKVKNSIFMLEIFSRQRLMYCEKIINRLLLMIQQNLNAMDQHQLIRMFFFYSKLKSSIKTDFVVKIVERIYLFMDQLTQRDYGMLVKALARLNYQDEELLKRLKNWNYELFLGNLKYDCSKLGSYYQKILDEVQNAFNSRRIEEQSASTEIDSIKQEREVLLS